MPSTTRDFSPDECRDEDGYEEVQSDPYTKWDDNWQRQYREPEPTAVQAVVKTARTTLDTVKSACNDINISSIKSGLATAATTTASGVAGQASNAVTKIAKTGTNYLNENVFGKSTPSKQPPPNASSPKQDIQQAITKDPETGATYVNLSVFKKYTSPREYTSAGEEVLPSWQPPPNAFTYKKETEDAVPKIAETGTKDGNHNVVRKCFPPKPNITAEKDDLATFLPPPSKQESEEGGSGK